MKPQSLLKVGLISLCFLPLSGFSNSIKKGPCTANAQEGQTFAHNLGPRIKSLVYNPKAKEDAKKCYAVVQHRPKHMTPFQSTAVYFKPFHTLTVTGKLQSVNNIITGSTYSYTISSPSGSVFIPAM